MKTNLFVLLCAVCVVLMSCNKDKANDPDPSPTPTPTEGDYVVKFYSCDSLLNYASFTIVDSTDLTLDCSQYTIARVDTAGDDARDWKTIKDILLVVDGMSPEHLNHDNIKIITLPVHLKAGLHHFHLVYTMMGQPCAEEIDVLGGGSYYTTTTELGVRESFSAKAFIGVTTDSLEAFIPLLNKMSLSPSF